MPLFYQQTIDRHTKIGVWKIEEAENFFLETVPLQSYITHPHKRMQHLAGRYLLRYLFPDFPYELIRIASTLKPFLENEAYHFSISHCDDFAAAIVSRDKRVGIDIETVSERVGRVKDKFINDAEAGIIRQFESEMSELMKFTLVWSCKEAMFKWYGDGQVDFKRHMQLQAIYNDEVHQCTFTDFLFAKEKARLLKLQTVFLEKFALSWLITEK